MGRVRASEPADRTDSAKRLQPALPRTYGSWELSSTTRRRRLPAVQPMTVHNDSDKFEGGRLGAARTDL